jgi:hypothetical protein
MDVWNMATLYDFVKEELLLRLFDSTVVVPVLN